VVLGRRLQRIGWRGRYEKDMARLNVKKSHNA
jgi:hypothetical protein